MGSAYLEMPSDSEFAKIITTVLFQAAKRGPKYRGLAAMRRWYSILLWQIFSLIQIENWGDYGKKILHIQDGFLTVPPRFQCQNENEGGHLKPQRGPVKDHPVFKDLWRQNAFFLWPEWNCQVTDFAFSPHDDGVIASGSQDGTVKVVWRHFPQNLCKKK